MTTQSIRFALRELLKTRLSLAYCALLGAALQAHSQTQVLVDPAKIWLGYTNVFNLPADGGGYLAGGPVTSRTNNARIEGGHLVTEARQALRYSAFVPFANFRAFSRPC